MIIMSKFLESAAHIIHRHHILILVLSLIITAACGIAIVNIRLNADLMDLMPDDNEDMKIFSRALKNFQNVDALTLVLESSDSDLGQYGDLIEAMGRALEGSPLVRDVNYSVFNMTGEDMPGYFPLYLNDRGISELKALLTYDGINRQVRKNYLRASSPFASPADIMMLEKDPLSIMTLLKRYSMKTPSEEMDLGSGYYLSRDHKRALIFVTPSGSGRDFAYLRDLRKQAEGIVKDVARTVSVPKDLSTGFTGGYAVSWEAQEAIRHDMLSSIVVTVFLVIIIFRLVYRGRPALFLAMAYALLSAMVTTLALAAFLFGSLNVVTAVVTAMLIGLGFDYVLHISDRYLMEYAGHRDSLKALEQALSSAGRSVLTSALTTAGAFFSIVITSFSGLHELGIIAGVGILACMVSSIIVLGAVLVFMSERGLLGDGLCKYNKLLEVCVPDLLVSRKGIFMTLCTVILVISASGLNGIAFDSDLTHMSLKDSQAIRLQQDVAGMITKRGAPLIVTVSAGDTPEIASDSLERLIASWKDRGIISDSVSAGNIFPPLYRQQKVIDALSINDKDLAMIEETFHVALRRYGFSSGPEQEAYIRAVSDALRIHEPVKLRDLPAGLVHRAEAFIDRGKQVIAAFLYPSGDQWTDGETVALRADIITAGPGWHLTGWDLLKDDLKSSIIREGIVSAILSMLFIIAVLYMHFRRPVIILLVAFPLLAGLVLTIGIMGLVHMGFNYINVAAIAMIFGISVDYGVYFMQNFLESGSRVDSTLVRHAIKNIIVCSLTTMAGFGSLVLAGFQGISSLGMVLIIGIASSLVLSLMLLPVSESVLRGGK